MDAQDILEDIGDVEKTVEKRKDKIIKWMKKPLNFSLFLVLMSAFFIRLYYFLMTKTQPLWWDEAVYGSLARNFISHSWDNTATIIGELTIRPTFFPFLWSILMRIGIGEITSRFLLEFVPSVLSVFLVYLIAKEVFNKKIGIITAFMFSFLWIHLFYTFRILTDIPSLFLVFLSIYYFIKATKFNLNFKYFSISLIALSIATLMRYPNGIIFFVYLIIGILFLFKEKSLLKNPKFYFSAIIGIFPILLFFLINLITKGNIFPTLLQSDFYFGAEKIAKPIAYNMLNYIPMYLTRVFFIFFLIGLAIILFELVVGYNFIIKNTKLRNYLLLLLTFVAIYSFFIFYLRVGEDRYFLITSLPLFCFTAFGIDYISKFIKKYNKYTAILFILIILFIGVYSQIEQADNIIKLKKQSYLEVKQGMEWLKENSQEDAVFAGGGGIGPYTIYYTERTSFDAPANYSESSEIEEADYLIVHGFTPQAEYINQYLEENQDKWIPMKVFFIDQEQKQPIFIIYGKT